MSSEILRPIRFRVYGIPRPGGSKRSFQHRWTGKTIVIDDCRKNKEWRKSVAIAASGFRQFKSARRPILLSIEFIMPRPASHFEKGRNAGKLKKSAPYLHTVTPDATKLFRSTEDALTGILWEDDCCVALQASAKRYCHPGEPPGAVITVVPIEEEGCVR